MQIPNRALVLVPQQPLQRTTSSCQRGLDSSYLPRLVCPVSRRGLATARENRGTAAWSPVSPLWPRRRGCGGARGTPAPAWWGRRTRRLVPSSKGDATGWRTIRSAHHQTDQWEQHVTVESQHQLHSRFAARNRDSNIVTYLRRSAVRARPPRPRACRTHPGSSSIPFAHKNKPKRTGKKDEHRTPADTSNDQPWTLIQTQRRM
jgi:hypothetical protein